MCSQPEKREKKRCGKMSNVLEMRNSRIILIEKVPGKGYALFIALLPILMMYRVPMVGIGVSTALLIIGFFYAASIIFENLQGNGWRLRIEKIIVPFIIYLLYTAIRSTRDMTNAVQTLLIIAHIFAFSTGAVNARYLKKYIVFIATLASSLVILQTLLYYSVGVHLPCIAPSLCLDYLSYYRDWILTGVRDIEHMYRPSAFFLEPSHFTQYSFVALLLLLFHEKVRINTAIWISMGILLTTSGMGIILVSCIWGGFLFKTIQRSSFSKKIFRTIAFSIVLGVIFCVLYHIPFFKAALARIISPIAYSTQGYNAIWGRTLYWNTYISPLRGKELLFGLGYVNQPAEYFTGLMELIYCAGILGATLYYFAMLTTTFKTIGISRILAAFICCLTVLANLTNLIDMTYYMGIIISFALEGITSKGAEEGISVAK